MNKFAKMLLSLFMFLSIAGCSKTKAPEYHFIDGTMSANETIEDYYTLEEDPVCVGVSIYDEKHHGNIVAVFECKVAGGGSVAWRDQYYSFSEDASKDTTGLHLIEHFNLK